MNTACETVKDLIPLYIDGDCSKTTEKLVKEHIKKCRDCAKYLKMCRHSAEMAEKRTKKNKEDADFVIIPDDGYEIIAFISSRFAMLDKVLSTFAAYEGKIDMLDYTDYENRSCSMVDWL